MEHGEQEAQALRKLLVSPDNTVPPREVVEAVETLLGGRAARCALSELEDVVVHRTERTNWMITVATDTDVIRVTAGGPKSDRQSPTSPRPDELGATCIPLTEITGLTASRVTDSDGVANDLVWIILFRSHEPMPVPGLSGVAQVGEFVRHLRSVWPTRVG